jgi:hypothetical protein
MAASMYWYRQGTVSVAAGGNVVTGVNTYWLTAIQPPVPGDAFSLDGDKWYEISEILADGQLKVHGTFPAALSAVGYMVKPVVSAAPALRISAEISAVLQQQRLFFLSLNDFWYKPGEVSVTDPFGVTHRHKTLYELNAGLADLSSRLQTMVATAEESVALFDALGQEVNTLSSTVSGLQSNVDAKLQSATTSANEAKNARDLALNYRNDANTALADVTGKHAQISTWHGNVNTALGDVTTRQGDVTTKHNDVVAKAADVVTKHGDVVTKSADVVTKHGDVVTKHGQVNTWYSAINGWQATVNTKHADVVSKHSDMLTATTNAQNSATLAQLWAAENEDVLVASGLYSARHYMLKAYFYAQQTAANVSGGVIFRGFHNPSGGFPAGAATGDQYKLSGSGTLTFEVDGAKAVTAGDYIIKTISGWVHLDDATDAVKITRKVNNKSLAADITLTAADVGAVPTTRTVNGKALSGDIALSAADVGARVSTWVPAWADVTGKPTTVASFGITDAVTTAGDQTIAGNKTFSNQLTAGNLVAVQAVVSRPFGGEGGQFVLGFPNAGAISGQTNNTWNIDVDSSNTLRFFRMNGTGSTVVPLTISESSGLVTVTYGLRVGANMTSTAGFNLSSQGVADPTALNDGDMWHRSNALFARLGGVTRTLIHSGNAATLASDISQTEAEAGASTTRRWFTAERVAQAIAAQAAPKTSTDDRLTALENAPNANETAELALALALLGL